MPQGFPVWLAAAVAAAAAAVIAVVDHDGGDDALWLRACGRDCGFWSKSQCSILHYLSHTIALDHRKQFLQTA